MDATRWRDHYPPGDQDESEDEAACGNRMACAPFLR